MNQKVFASAIFAFSTPDGRPGKRKVVGSIPAKAILPDFTLLSALKNNEPPQLLYRGKY